VKKTSRPGRVVLVFSFLILILSFSVTGATLQVCKIGCEFSSIGEAIRNASSGDRIRVQNGNYSESLSIDRDITLVGANTSWARITQAESSTPAIVVGPSDATVELRNITIINEGEQGGSGVTVTGDSRLTLIDSRVTGFRNSFRVKDSGYLKLRNVEVRNSEVGVASLDNSEVILSGSRIISANRGLVANNNSRVTIVDSEVTNCENNAVLVRETARLNALSSRVTNNRAPGIILRDFSRLNLEESQVGGNEGGGILLTNSAIANLNDNSISYNEKKNVAVISKKCGFSGPSEQFFGEVNGAGNEIKPANPDTICPVKFSEITSSGGGSYSYPFTPSTYAFIGLIGVATVYFLISR